MDQLVFLKSNFGINPNQRPNNKKESHPVLIYQNHQIIIDFGGKKTMMMDRPDIAVRKKILNLNVQPA